MNTQPGKNHRAGLTLLSGLVIFACVILIGYFLMKTLLKCIEKMPPPTHPAQFDTNIVGYLPPELFYAVPVKVEMPAFTFDTNEVMALDAEDFLAHGAFLIERSTNMVDWTPAWRIDAMSQFNFAADTNGLSLPRCFYRAVLVP